MRNAAILLVAAIGGFLGYKKKIPAGFLIGSLVFAAIFNSFVYQCTLPPEIKILSQAGCGAYIGLKVKRSHYKEFKEVAGPALILMGSIIVFSICIAVIVSRFGRADITTALFATAPAGTTDMTLISMDFHANTAQVAFLQVFRLVGTILLIPIVVRFVVEKRGLKTYNSSPRAERSKEAKEVLTTKQKVTRLAATLLIAIAAGLLGYILGIPAGTITFSMIAIVLFNLKTSKGFMPMTAKGTVQCLSGALIGSRVTKAELEMLATMWPEIIIILLCYVAFTLVTGYLIYKFTRLDPVTALFACSAGGLTDITLISEEMGANFVEVMMLHLVRYIFTVSCYPIVISLILNFA